MAEDKEKTDLIECKHVTTVCYKDRNGAVKTVNIVQPMDPDQRRMTFADIQMLAKQITIQLKLDAE